MTEPEKAILVVGTTQDYISLIRKTAVVPYLFLTDIKIGRQDKENSFFGKEQVLCQLSDVSDTAAKLAGHLRRWNLVLAGITCFDCESMKLAAVLARRYSLPYPSVRSIGLCRDKYASKIRWKGRGLKCPQARRVRSAGDAARFLIQAKGLVVLKPASGSGSEMVFLCASAGQARGRYRLIRSLLWHKRNDGLYKLNRPASELIVAEEYIEGQEYSCDYLIDARQARLLRLTKKIPERAGPFGTTHGYLLTDCKKAGINQNHLLRILSRSAESLGMARCIGMMDFIVKDKAIYLLETAPRFGGDCLAYLLRKACFFDIFKFSFQFAAGKSHMPGPKQMDARAMYLGFKILGKKQGRIQSIDLSAAQKDKRVLEIGLSAGVGHIIKKPPLDVDSRVLGYGIARLDPSSDPAEQLEDIHSKIIIRMS